MSEVLPPDQYNDFVTKVPLVLRREPVGHPPHLLGRVTNGRVEYYDSRVADMCLWSHFMTGETILEQSKDGLLGDS